MLCLVIHSKLPFPFDSHPLCLGQVCESRFPCHSECAHYASSTLPGRFEHSFCYWPGRPGINSNNSRHWPSHEALRPFQERLDIPDFSTSLDHPPLIKCVLSVYHLPSPEPQFELEFLKNGKDMSLH